MDKPGITPDRWRQIEDLFRRAMQYPESKRAAFLREACAGDPTLQRELESFLSQASTQDLTLPVASSAFIHSKPARPTWWMYLIGASYVLSFGLIIYLVAFGPVELRGIVAAFENETMVVRSVNPDSQLARGGLLPGDRVVSINGVPMRAVRDWNVATGNLEANHTQPWVVLRNGSPQTLDIFALKVTGFRQRMLEGYPQYLSLAISGFVLGLLIAWKRPVDPVARIGAWFIMTAGIAFGLPQGWAVPWREFPVAAQWLLWIPELSRFVLEAIYLSFFLLFPRRVVTRRWIWFAVWLPVLVTTPWRISAFYTVIHPGSFAPVPAWILQAGFARTIIYLVLGMIILALSYRRLLDANEKRRVRVLIVGTTLSAISATLTVWADSFAGRNLQLSGFLFTFVIIPFNTACPASLAYAILRHRILDIQVIIRQGLQYALARGAVLGIVPALGALLIVDLAFNSQEPLASIMRSRGWIYATLSGLALITHYRRKPWLDSLDRRFFRERYNAQRVLRDVVDEIRIAKGFERVAPQVVARIESALHSQYVAVMIRQPDDHSYRTLTCIPVAQAPTPLRADSKLVGLMHLLGKPLEGLAGDSKWLDQRLPRHELDTVRKNGIDLLLPIAVHPGGTEAILVLGVKRSEEPYMGEDQELLEAIASSLGLLLEQSGDSSQRLTGIFEECSQCGTCYDPRSGTCVNDGITLTPVRLPRVLAGRYRLERRRGHGGMGTVYEATDNSLHRRVAVKVIRDDWMGSPEAAQRFRREARASASFAHPNVVTVYDFGIEAERGFLVMELLTGETLRDELNRTKRLSPNRTLQLMRGVCAAVDAAHEQRLIHRDLKPENIFVAGTASAERVKVLDFGVAKFLSSDDSNALTLETNTGVLIGTLSYMSPEQLLGEKPDTSWDLWALSVVSYETLTGSLPFGPSSSKDWRSGILSGSFIALEQFLPNPPVRWEQFFAKTFSSNRGKRPQTVAEFIRLLEEALSEH